MSKQVHVVMGSTGEYSDNREWAVVAYLALGDAQAHVTRCDEWLREHHVSMDQEGPIADPYGQRGDLKCPYDDGFSYDYTGTRYYVMSVDLAEGHG